MKEPDWLPHADQEPETDPREEYCCERCKEKLDPKTLVWLELNWRTGRYSKPGTVPEADSQGCFSFGKACARRVLAEGGKVKP